MITSVLFVCMGNICRSPMALAVCEQWRDRGHGNLGPNHAVRMDSAGTHAHHLGEPMDPRAAAALAARNYAVRKRRSRRIAPADFESFDLILAMDAANLSTLRASCPPAYTDKLRLFLGFASGGQGLDVPDPYYGNAQGFERVLDLCELGASALVKTLHC